jgi:hypothetical protein
MRQAEVVSMTSRYDLIIKQGATFDLNINYKDDNNDLINLSSYTARMQIRSGYNGTLYSTLTTENGGIILNSPVGRIELYISDTDTSAFTFEKGIYDLELIDGDDKVTRLLQGTVTVWKEVTK